MAPRSIAADLAGRLRARRVSRRLKRARDGAGLGDPHRDAAVERWVFRCLVAALLLGAAYLAVG